MMMFKTISARVFSPQASIRGFHATSSALAYPTAKTGRPLTAYIRFVQEHRAEVMKKEPNLTIPECGRRMGELWRALPNSTREAYKEEFQKAFSEYKAKGGK